MPQEFPGGALRRPTNRHQHEPREDAKRKGEEDGNTSEETNTPLRAAGGQGGWVGMGAQMQPDQAKGAFAQDGTKAT